jgi:transcriptional regulator with XRE-family HTH domain
MLPNTEIQLRWLYTCTNLSYRKIAEGTKVSHSTINRWMKLQKRPSKRQEIKIWYFVLQVIQSKNFTTPLDTFIKNQYNPINDPVFGPK